MTRAAASLKLGQRRDGFTINLDGDLKLPRRKGTGAAHQGRPSTRRQGCQPGFKKLSKD